MHRILSLLALCLLPLGAQANGLLCASDPLAPHDEYGTLHQMPDVNRIDLAPRYPTRISYYFLAAPDLEADPAYVGALQRDLNRLGYYAGAIDGVYSAQVSAAIARLQKNSSQPVTGTLTYSVRRALHLP